MILNGLKKPIQIGQIKPRNPYQAGLNGLNKPIKKEQNIPVIAYQKGLNVQSKLFKFIVTSRLFAQNKRI